jgi:hypothetical protein
VQAGVDLVQVVRASHAPLREVAREYVVAPLVGLGVALCFVCEMTLWGMEWGCIVHILVVNSLRGSEPHVVVSGSGVLSERSH